MEKPIIRHHRSKELWHESHDPEHAPDYRAIITMAVISGRLQTAYSIRGGLGEIIGASPRLRLICAVSLFLPSVFFLDFHCQPRGYISKDGERMTMSGRESW